MQGINILVVEDEGIVAKDIQQSLKKLGYNVVGVSSTAEQAIEKATELKPELVLMDIMLKGELSGIDAAMEIRNKLDIPVVFLTAYADSATLNKAKETEPFGYIIKPFKEIDLHTSIEMALYKHKKESQVRKERDFLYSIIENMEGNGIIFIKSNSKLVKLKTSDIYFIEALKDYVTINTKTARYTIHSTMKDIQAKLPQNEFIRVHRSFIVRVDKIGSIDFPNLVLEEDKKVIPIGGSYKDELYQKLKLI
jgi:DNA-binding LytR/AlgR family response regulator